MIKKFITIAGINNNVNIVDGDREVDQGKVVMIVIDRYLDPRVVFSILKRNNPNLVLLSSGLLNIIPNNSVIMVEGNQLDQSIIDNHILDGQVVISVTTRECLYTKNITNDRLINMRYPIGKLSHLLKIVSFIS